jgi:hypothetical protein
VGNEVFLDTRLLPVGYLNVTGKANDSNNSRKFQHSYPGPFTLLRKAGKNGFILDIATHWRLHPVFNISQLKLSRVDRSSKYPSLPPLRSTTAATEYKVETILEHRGTTTQDLEYLVKWVGYVNATWEPLDNLKGSSNELLGEYHAANGLWVNQWMG